MEREKTLSTSDAGSILETAGVNRKFLTLLLAHAAIRPTRRGTAKSPLCWGPKDIFRAYACKVKVDEYIRNHPKEISEIGSIIEYLRKDLPGLDHGGYKKFTSSKEWEKITEAAAKKGLDFRATQYSFNPDPD